MANRPKLTRQLRQAHARADAAEQKLKLVQTVLDDLVQTKAGVTLEQLMLLTWKRARETDAGRRAEISGPAWLAGPPSLFNLAPGGYDLWRGNVVPVDGALTLDGLMQTYERAAGHPWRTEYLGEFPTPVVHQLGNGDNRALCGEPLDMNPGSMVTCPECLGLLYPPGVAR